MGLLKLLEKAGDVEFGRREALKYGGIVLGYSLAPIASCDVLIDFTADRERVLHPGYMYGYTKDNLRALMSWPFRDVWNKLSEPARGILNEVERRLRWGDAFILCDKSSENPTHIYRREVSLERYGNFPEEDLEPLTLGYYIPFIDATPPVCDLRPERIKEYLETRE